MKILKFIVICCLCILLTGTSIWGMDVPIPPIEPTELTEETVNEYNQEVDEYNQEVDEYNQAQQEQYEQDLTEYNDSLIHNQEEDEKVKEVEEANLAETERVNEINQQREAEALAKQEEAIQHNEEEDQKVAENQQALEQQEKTEQYIEMFKERGIDNATAESEDLPTDWTDTTTPEELKTIKIEQAEEPSDEEYKVMNIHFYLNENAGDVINDDVNFDENDNPVFSEDLQNSFTLAEWETVTVNKNDIVTVISEAEAMGYRSASFYRYMEGYTNGYWTPNYNIFMSTAVYSDSIWYKGAAQEFSYIDGTTDRQPIKNVMSLYAYSFVRTGDEPTKVEEYTPDYWDTEFPVEYEEPNYQEYTPNYITKENPTIPTLLNPLAHLVYTPPVIPEQPIEPEPEQPTTPAEEPTTPIIEEPTVPIEEPTTPAEEPTVPSIEEPTTEEPIIPIIIEEPVEEETTVIIEIEPEIPVIIEEPTYPNIENEPIIYIETTPTIIEIEDLDVPLTGGKQLYDFRGIPIQYSPGESGIYVGSNRGMKPTGGYLLRRNQNDVKEIA